MDKIDTQNSTTSNTIRAIAERISREYMPEKIILFGSRAWGETSGDSDIDLFIVKETNERPSIRQAEVRRLIHDLRRRIPMDILVLTPFELKKRLSIGDQFCQKVLREGVILYE